MELEHEIHAVWRQAGDIERRAGCLERWHQNGMLDLRGLDLRMSAARLREAADKLQTLADNFQPYHEPRPNWTAYEAELQAAE
jgi:hypothetical protein